MMDTITSLLTVLNRDNALQDSKVNTFQPGQILNGKIIKLFPNGIASLQVGSQKIAAQLEASLDVQQRYWFQVQPSNGNVKLKVIGKGVSTHLGVQDEKSILQLMESLSIPNKGTRSEAVKFFLKEQLPINKEVIEKSAELLKNIKTQQNGLQAIKLILQKQLPLSKDTFNSILAVLEQASLSESIENLRGLLQTAPVTDTQTKLILLLNKYFQSTRTMEQELLEPKEGGKQNATPSSGQLLSVADGLTKLIHRIGYNYENSLLQTFSKENKDVKIMLKPLLIDLLKETVSESIKTAAEKLLYKITGIQLLSHESSPMKQQVVQIPLFFQNQNIDLTIQWSGRKSNGHEIDQDYCRIVFFLELANLGDTLIDMQVQNRIINITVMNKHDDIKVMAQPLIFLLKEQLNSIDYMLSTVQFESFTQSPLQKGQSVNLFTSSTYSGVDLRI